MFFFLITEHKNAINEEDIVFSGFSALIIWAFRSSGLCIAFIPLSAFCNQQLKSIVPVEKQAAVFCMGLKFARMRVSIQPLTLKG
jgi:hypothetical protein